MTTSLSLDNDLIAQNNGKISGFGRDFTYRSQKCSLQSQSMLKIYTLLGYFRLRIKTGKRMQSDYLHEVQQRIAHKAVK